MQCWTWHRVDFDSEYDFLIVQHSDGLEQSCSYFIVGFLENGELGSELLFLKSGILEITDQCLPYERVA